MLKSAKQIIERNCLTAPLVIGVSGGSDSMCLLSLFLSSHLINKSQIEVVHINHSLRNSSLGDQKLVEDFCLKHGLRFVCFKEDIRALSIASKESIETTGRLARKRILSERSGDNALLVLGHTLDDQAETLLMHMFRGCGLNGLIGMSERDGNIVRPLIYTSKQEVYEYCRHNNIPFNEDETNFDTSYTRNHIRKLLASAKQKYPAASSNLSKLSLFARQNLVIVDGLLNQKLIILDNNIIPASVLKLDALKTPLAPYYVLAALKKLGLMANIEQKHIEIIIDFGLNATRGDKIDLPNKLLAYKESDSIEFCFSSAPKPFFVSTLSTSNVIESGKLKVDGDLLCNYEKRYRRNGDIFCPCNAKPQKLKDYLSQRQIKNRLRDHIPLLAIGNEILFIADIALSDKIKITKQTAKPVEIIISYKKD